MKRCRSIFILFMLVIIAMPRMESQTIKVSTKKRDRDKSGKVIYSDWVEMDTRTVDGLPNFNAASRADFTKYGSDGARKFKATGFFRVEKIGDRWWIIDPEGYVGYNVAVNSVNVGKSERNQAAFLARYGDREHWIDSTNLKLQEYGFNGTGSWSEHDLIRSRPSQHSQPMTYCINWNFMSAYGKERGGTYQLPPIPDIRGMPFLFSILLLKFFVTSMPKILFHIKVIPACSDIFRITKCHFRQRH